MPGLTQEQQVNKVISGLLQNKKGDNFSQLVEDTILQRQKEYEKIINENNLVSLAEGKLTHEQIMGLAKFSNVNNGKGKERFYNAILNNTFLTDFEKFDINTIQNLIEYASSSKEQVEKIFNALKTKSEADLNKLSQKHQAKIAGIMLSLGKQLTLDDQAVLAKFTDNQKELGVLADILNQHDDIPEAMTEVEQQKLILKKLQQKHKLAKAIVKNSKLNEKIAKIILKNAEIVRGLDKEALKILVRFAYSEEHFKHILASPNIDSTVVNEIINKATVGPDFSICSALLKPTKSN